MSISDLRPPVFLLQLVVGERFNFRATTPSRLTSSIGIDESAVARVVCGDAAGGAGGIQKVAAGEICRLSTVDVLSVALVRRFAREEP